MKLHKCTSQDGYRPDLTHVYIDEKNIVATNVHVIVCIPKTHIEGMENLPKMFIKSKDWAKLIPFGKKFFIQYENGFLVSYVYQKVGRNSVKVIADKNIHSIIKPILQEFSDMKFPNYEAVFYSTTEKPVELSEIGLSLRKINQIKEGMGCNNVSLTFYGKERAMIIKPIPSEDLDGRIGLLMPVLLTI